MTLKVNELMEQKNITFQELSTRFSCSKQTLTKKLNGTLDWTFPEMMILSEVLGIEDVQRFFNEL